MGFLNFHLDGSSHEVTLDLLKERAKLNDGYITKFVAQFQPNELGDLQNYSPSNISN